MAVKQKATKDCTDKNCPNHGSLKTRGRTFIGTVISSKAQKTVTVEWKRRHYLPKFERYERRRTRMKAHNPPCIGAVEGDVVRIMETRPLSKAKNFVVVERVPSTPTGEKTA